MKNSDIMDLYQGLVGTSNLTGVKFCYAIARNIKKLEAVVESVQIASIPPEIFKEYEQERRQFAQKSSKKDEKGNPVTEVVNDVKRFVMSDSNAFEAGFKVIKEKHKEALQKRKEQLEEVRELLKVETEIDLFTIPTSCIPEEVNTKQMTAIMPIIKD